jgi:Arc/MetJ family transcription regulator
LPDWFERLVEIGDDLVAEAEAAHDHPTTRDIVDTARVRALATSLGDDPSTADPRGHQFALPRALHIARYVRWFESRTWRSDG